MDDPDRAVRTATTLRPAVVDPMLRPEKVYVVRSDALASEAVKFMLTANLFYPIKR